MESAIALARRGGRVILLGLAGNGVTARFPVDDVVNNDLRITASFACLEGPPACAGTAAARRRCH